MINQNLLLPGVQAFMFEHVQTDVAKLALEKWQFEGVSKIEVLQQIAAKQKAKQKLPTWYKTPNILYPSNISVEQTSSEVTAAYKSSLVSGQKMLDLTAGFGVDAYYFSNYFEEVICTEQQAELLQISEHNARIFKKNNLKFITTDGVSFLENTTLFFDLIYLDPSRRNAQKQKVFLLEDCQPNIINILDLCLKKAPKILIKLSPMVDLDYLFKTLQGIQNIYIVSYQNEVKELLLEIVHQPQNQTIHAVELSKNQETISTWQVNKISQETVNYALPQKFLYDPWACLTKTGKTDCYAAQNNLQKLHPNTNLYTSNSLNESFFGRVFQVTAVLDYNKNNLKKQLQNSKASVVSKNFPLKSEQLRKNLNLLEDDQIFYFFVTALNQQKIVVLCKRLK